MQLTLAQNECIKDENEFLISLIVGEGIMLNNYQGKVSRSKELQSQIYLIFVLQLLQLVNCTNQGSLTKILQYC